MRTQNEALRHEPHHQPPECSAGLCPDVAGAVELAGRLQGDGTGWTGRARGRQGSLVGRGLAEPLADTCAGSEAWDTRAAGSPGPTPHSVDSAHQTLHPKLRPTQQTPLSLLHQLMPPWKSRLALQIVAKQTTSERAEGFSREKRYTCKYTHPKPDRNSLRFSAALDPQGPSSLPGKQKGTVLGVGKAGARRDDMVILRNLILS